MFIPYPELSLEYPEGCRSGGANTRAFAVDAPGKTQKGPILLKLN
jgi:hypothetical protein